MPRPRNADAPSPKKRRSRTGCWPCKARKVKCGEEKPQCANCVKQGETCDYSIRLQWGGRSKKDQDAFAAAADSHITFEPAWHPSAPSAPFRTPVTSSSAPATYTPSPSAATSLSSWTTSDANVPASDARMFMIDPQLVTAGQNVRTVAPESDRTSSPRAQAHLHSTILPRTSPAGTYTSTPHSSHLHSHADSSSLTCSPKRIYSDSRSLPYPLPPSDFNWSEQHRAKRVKLSPFSSSRSTLPPAFTRPELPDSVASNVSQYDQASPGPGLFTPYSNNSNVNTPGTPGSSIVSEDFATSIVASRHNNALIRQSPNLRRLSVNSLLSGPPGDRDSHLPRASTGLRYPKTDEEGSTVYGYDYGYPDLDMFKNNDSVSINPQSPADTRSGVTSAAQSPFTLASDDLSPAASEEAAFQRGGYYAHPVPIKISKEFEPLPSYLTSSPMNLLYFHHFLNHTARVLTPHDCADNPLRTTLPKMAIHDPDLLNLLFAYSASHRARLLSHPEPKDRIAYWMRHLFPNLRRALSSQEPVSDATLATAIMLASREIITPNTFEVNIPWQNHLGIARQMIIRRGGLKEMVNSPSPVVNFLARWFAYLDVIGSLCGHQNDAPLFEFPQDIHAHSGENSHHDFAIDCFFGFTNCCIGLLARVAKLAHECDKERIDADRNINPDWEPSERARDTARKLVMSLRENRGHVYAACRHSKRDNPGDLDMISDSSRLDLQEIVSVNEAFHLAGLIHVYRRVLGKQSADDEVQECVRQVLVVLDQVRKGARAEGCMLFPMFTAGCDAVDPEHRDAILERLRLVEGQTGMTHVQKARTLMQTSWETGKPWETLVSGEFFG